MELVDTYLRVSTHVGRRNTFASTHTVFGNDTRAYNLGLTKGQSKN